MVVSNNPNPRLMIALVSFALGVLVSLLMRGCADMPVAAPSMGRVITRTEVRRDTVVQVRERPVTRIVRRVHPVTVRDTIPTAVAPFVARLDTIVGDTLSIAYQWPENRMDVELRRRPDSIRTVTVDRLQEVIHRPQWSVGVSGGYGLVAQHSPTAGWSITTAPYVGLSLTYNLFSL